MSDELFKKTVWERIHHAQDECADLSDQYDKLYAELQELAALKVALEVKISNWQELVTDAEKNTSGTASAANDSGDEAARRMRLGSKKRVIYQMIAWSVDSVEEIEHHLRYSDLDIDARYARDVVRNGITKGDFSGVIDGKIVTTPAGDEILKKAPLPKDWDEFEPGLMEIFRSDDEDRADMFD